MCGLTSLATENVQDQGMSFLVVHGLILHLKMSYVIGNACDIRNFALCAILDMHIPCVSMYIPCKYIYIYTMYIYIYIPCIYIYISHVNIFIYIQCIYIYPMYIYIYISHVYIFIYIMYIYIYVCMYPYVRRSKHGIV